MMNYHFGYYFKMPSQANVFFFSQIGNGQGNVMDFTAEHFVSKEVHSHMLKGGQWLGKESCVFPRKASHPLEEGQ